MKTDCLKKTYFYLFLIGIIGFLTLPPAFAQNPDTLACSNNVYRSWWKVNQYRLTVDFRDTLTGAIKGENKMLATVLSTPKDRLQIDLDNPMTLQKVIFHNTALSFSKQGNHYLVDLKISGKLIPLKIKDTFSLKFIFKGRPKDAQNAPWSGGFVRTKDSTGSLWWAVACQDEGASLWFPCKNFQGDEPDSVLETYIVHNTYQAIGNGRLISSKPIKGHLKSYTWRVVNPINNYDITFYIGKYVHWHEVYPGKQGSLDLSFYVLPHDFVAAQKQFKEVKSMLSCFEDKFGPYPFYRDGYKLVEAPYLGMEHQSAVAYGNGFQMGYNGRDRSNSGVGMLFDFIIIHESAHEWFGNSITAYDKADEWIHEGFASYAETIYAECLAGRDKSFKYQEGKRRTIENKTPVEGKLNACDDGSTDAYDKAGFLIHTIRLLINDDGRFFGMLRGLNRKYQHQIVTGKEIESFIHDYSGLELSKIFDQYLRTAALPVLTFSEQPNGTLKYQWIHCVPGFNMPVIWEYQGKQRWLYPSTTPQYLDQGQLTSKSQISPDFLIDVEWNK